MKVQKDFEELLRLLNSHKVRYCVVGSYALAFHGHPRYTKDMDILIDSTADNARKLIAALNEFGFESLRLTEQDFTTAGQVIQLGYEPVRIDILTSIAGCTFAEAWEGKIEGEYGDEKVFFIGLEHLIKSKKATGRLQDEADLEYLTAKKEPD